MSGLVDGAPRPPRLCARRDRADRRPVRATRPPEPRRVPGPRGLVARAAFGAWMSPSSAACFYLAPTSRGKFAKIAARRLRKRKVPDAQGTPKSCQATLSSTGQPSGEAFGGVLGERTAIIGRIPRVAYHGHRRNSGPPYCRHPSRVPAPAVEPCRTVIIGFGGVVADRVVFQSRRNSGALPCWEGRRDRMRPMPRENAASGPTRSSEGRAGRCGGVAYRLVQRRCRRERGELGCLLPVSPLLASVERPPPRRAAARLPPVPSATRAPWSSAGAPRCGWPPVSDAGPADRFRPPRF